MDKSQTYHIDEIEQLKRNISEQNIEKRKHTPLFPLFFVINQLFYKNEWVCVEAF